jgi:N-sulfoglucosamine sulfohydrolase
MVKRFNRLLIACSLVICVAVASAARSAERPNLLIITVDDMNCDSVGAFGCALEGTTPHIDKLAAEGMRFHYAHVQVGNCYPSRNVMFSGRYPHNTGVEGFYQVKHPDYPHLVDLVKQAGYFVGIRGKVSHSTPYQPYAWDADLTVLDGEKQDMKQAESYYRSTQRGIEMASSADKPFCLNINISDPHKPFYAMGRNGKVVEDPNVPPRVFEADEVPIPGFLFDHPDVRKELAHYYSSVRRADDCFAAVMRALDESGQRDETVVFFLSDHGMPLPFAKTQLWHHSTRTPWIVRWPGVTRPGSVDKQHMISAVDLLPTLCDIAGITPPEGFDGSSFIKVLKGDTVEGRDAVFKVYNENAGGNRNPMRSVETKRFGYIFNPWSDGKRVFRTATTGTMTYRTMRKLADENEQIAARLDLFDHRLPEEFYDYQNDPDAQHNLIDDPKYAEQRSRLRNLMRRFMVESNDPLLEVFDRREDPQFVSDYVDQAQAESDERRKNRRSARRSPRKQNPKLFTISFPKHASAGEAFTVTVHHRLPETLGKQKFHVTLKDSGGRRIERIVKSASGTGELTVTFQLAKDLATKSLQVATFVGSEYPRNLLHRSEGPVPLSK